MRKLASILVVLLASSALTFSQDYNTTNKKAIAAYEEAVKNFQYRYYAQAEESILKALKADEYFSDAYYLLAGIYTEQNQIEKVLLTLEKCVSLCAQKDPWSYYKFAYELAENGVYEKAVANLLKLKESGAKLSPKKLEYLDGLLTKSNVAINLMNNPVEFNPQNMGNKINSDFDDYHPAITVDDNFFIYTSRVPNPQARGNQEDLFFNTKNNDGSWKERKPLGRPINTPDNEGAQSITADGNKMIFTICNAPGGYGSCDIYITEKQNSFWKTPKNIGPVINTSKWESQPSLSADGRTLYFASNRPGGYGNKDIWMSTQNELGEWTPPVNLGAMVNTKMEDETPFIHADGVTLYFSSDGHPGMGKKDIYKTNKLSGNAWSQPQNLGYPINTHNKDSYIIVNAKGDKAYFSSNRYGARSGSMDIYEFDMPTSIRPNSVTYIKGTVFDAADKNKKLSATVSLYELKTGNLLYKFNSDIHTGTFMVPFVEGVDYALTIEHNGYLFYSENVCLKSIESSIEIPLQPMLVGKPVVLNNVFFDVDSDILKPESAIELLTIVNYMKQNPTICFEIGGHTDNTGSTAYNTELSSKRAKAVYSFLTSKGIPAARLSYKGYADSKPVVANDSPENRAKNRRTELIITKQ